MKCIALIPLLLTTQCTAQKSTAAASTSRKPLQFTSPLQSLTIFEPSSQASPRAKFLPRLRAGLLAERRARDIIANELRSGQLGDSIDVSDGGWAEHSAKEEERRKTNMDARLEKAYDEAMALYDARVAARDAKRAAAAPSVKSTSAYQFVGVVNVASGSKKDVTWYARKKPRSSKWNVRLIHVNRDAVLRDLFVKGKIDLFAGYKNEGIGVVGGSIDDNEANGEGGGARPKILGEYHVKERSWRTLWNFSPIRYFTTPSGSYHRERRLTPGIYTDGTTVYESVYRYRDGKNGMKPVGLLDRYLESLGDEKEGIKEKLKGIPDVVVEK